MHHEGHAVFAVVAKGRRIPLDGLIQAGTGLDNRRQQRGHQWLAFVVELGQEVLMSLYHKFLERLKHVIVRRNLLVSNGNINLTVWNNIEIRTGYK